MKKITIISVLIFCVIAFVILMTKKTTVDTDITKKRTKVAMILNGKINDHSWSESHYKGLQKTAEALNLEVKYIENVMESGQSLGVMEQLVKDGSQIIIANSFGFGEYELQMAAKYPDRHFFHCAGIKESQNLATYFGRIYQARYLSGIVAGLQTKTNEIGYIAAFDISEVNRGINAFTLGVRSVNPKAKVYVDWSHSWISDEAALESIQSLTKYHKIDVITAHTDALSQYKYAEDHGIWIIGYNVDNSSRYPKTFLTAPIWQWDAFYTARILETLQNKFVGRHYWEGAESGIISLAPLTANVVEGVAEIVEREKEKLKNGFFDVFYGPIKDNTGKIRIEAGESMTDEEMLNKFDWYVEGVEINAK